MTFAVTNKNEILLNIALNIHIYPKTYK